MSSNTQLRYPYTSLDHVEDLIKVGFDDRQSKAQAKALFRVVDQNAVTKQDLKELDVKLTMHILTGRARMSWVFLHVTCVLLSVVAFYDEIAHH